MYVCIGVYLFMCVQLFLYFRSSFPQASPLAVVQQNQFATKNDDEKEDGDEEQWHGDTSVALGKVIDGWISQLIYNGFFGSNLKKVQKGYKWWGERGRDRDREELCFNKTNITFINSPFIFVFVQESTKGWLEREGERSRNKCKQPNI